MQLYNVDVIIPSSNLTSDLILKTLIENIKDKNDYIEEVFRMSLYTLETLEHRHINHI